MLLLIASASILSIERGISHNQKMLDVFLKSLEFLSLWGEIVVKNQYRYNYRCNCSKFMRLSTIYVLKNYFVNFIKCLLNSTAKT